MAQKDFLFSRLEDAAANACQWGKAVYDDFYEATLQRKIEREIGRYPEADCLFFGGHEYTERRMLAVFPKGNAPDEFDFPIDCLFIKITGEYSHPDVLGALLGLGIERDKLGDIDIIEGGAQVFVASPLGEFIKNNLQSVSRYEVQTQLLGLNEVRVSEPQFQNMSVIIPSMRIDAIIHCVFRLSRSEAAAFVKGEKVFINGNGVIKPGAGVPIGDVVSVRSKGKFIVEGIAGNTKKGNIKLNVRKFS